MINAAVPQFTLGMPTVAPILLRSGEPGTHPRDQAAAPAPASDPVQFSRIYQVLPYLAPGAGSGTARLPDFLNVTALISGVASGT